MYVVSFIDRQIIGILSPFIKEDLGFTDTQLGWLKGLAFAFLYAIAGIPIAWLADRYSRKKIITLALIAWSGFTALTGAVSSFIYMFLARMGVGIGEAGGSPPSHSIISDLYPKEKRASALGFYSLGIPIGIGFSYLLAGALVESLGWRGTLIFLGGFGILLAIVLAIVVKEPKRGQLDGENLKLKTVGIWESIVTLAKIPSWFAMCMGIAWVSFGGYAVSAWGIDYILRFKPEYLPPKYGGEPGSFKWLMFWFGMLHLFGYGAGTYFGALLTEKLAKRSVSFYGIMPGAVLLIGVPALIAAFWVQSIIAHLFFVTIYLISAGFYLGPSFAPAQTLAPINMRAMSTALFFMILNIIALGGGPTFVGIMSERLMETHGNVHSLRLAMSMLVVPYILSVLAFFWAAKTLPKDWDEADRRNKEMAAQSET
jgi:MFS family permease